LDGDDVVSVEHGEAVDQDVGSTEDKEEISPAPQQAKKSGKKSNIRNVKAIGVEGETAGSTGIKESVLDGVVVTADSHVPTSGTKHISLDSAKTHKNRILTRQWAFGPCSR
jgi:hypothetical protein